jgi:hypothetical protein
MELRFERWRKEIGEKKKKERKEKRFTQRSKVKKQKSI